MPERVMQHAVVLPQVECSKAANKTNPYRYDFCPQCGALKAKAASICRDCRTRKPDVEQPSDPEIRLIPLTRGKVAIVDVEDYDWLIQWNWSIYRCPANGKYYAVRSVRGGHPHLIYMARALMGYPPNQHVDHQNGDSLDNRRFNLRPATTAQNSSNRGKPISNTSGFKGVSWSDAANKWSARIGYKGRNLYLGVFDDIREAAAAYNEAATRLHGEFAVLNQL